MKHKLYSAKPFLTDEAGEDIYKDIIVCRVNVPDIPKPHNPVLRHPLGAVLCAFKYDDGWAFVGLSGEQKHEIGDALIADRIPIGEWADIVIGSE